MMEKRTKLLAILVVLTMIFTLILPGTAFAEGSFDGVSDGQDLGGELSDPGSGTSYGPGIDSGSDSYNSESSSGPGIDSDLNPDLDSGFTSLPEMGPLFIMSMPRDGNLYVDYDGAVDDTHFQTIQDAVNAAEVGDTIYVAAGEYTEPKITITKNLTIIGEDRENTIIKPSVNFTGANHSDNAAWFVVNDGVTFNLSDVTLDAEGKNVLVGIMSHGSGSIENNIFKNIRGGHDYNGVAIELLGSDMTVTGNTFSNIQRIGVFIGQNSDTAGAVIQANTYVGKGTGNFLDYAFEVGRDGRAEIIGNTISGNKGIASTDNSSSAGIQITSYYGSGASHAIIEDNVISDCSIGVLVGYDNNDISVVTINENNLEGNGIGIKSTAPTVNGKWNWWGANDASGILELISGNVDFEPWYTSEAMGELVYRYSVVNQDLEASYETIQAAIDAADAGDIIKVAPGVYNENISIIKPLTLLGATHGIDKTSEAYNTVTSDGTWDTSQESVIQSPDPSQRMSCVVDIKGASDVTFDGFVVQELHAVSAQYDSLVRVSAKEPPRATIQNINVINNIIGPFTNIEGQDGSQGRMGLYIVNDPYNANVGVINSTFAHNRIFGAEGNGNNVFIWSAYHAYGAAGPCPMTGTAIEENDIYGANRSGIEIAGGVKDLIIRSNKIHDNGMSDTTDSIKYGNGILMIRGNNDKEDSSGLGPENLTIQNNEIYNNEKNGIYSGPMIKDTLIKENRIQNNGWHGVVVDLQEQYYSGVNPVLDGATGVTLTDNTITGNTTGAAVQGDPSNSFVLKAIKNWWGTNVNAEIQAAVSPYVSFDPWYASAAMDTLDSAKPVINETKGTSYDTIQAAISDAASGDSIYVKAGNYRENVNINKNNLTLRGAGAANTKIVATTATASALTFSSSGSTAEGFTLTHEYTTAELSAWSTINNNGVSFASNHNGNTLKNCTVTLNRNGIYLNTTQNNQILDNMITNNRSGINMTNNINGTRIEGNTISDNWTVGLVTYSLGGPANLDTVVITGNTFDSNWYSEVIVKDTGAYTGTLDVSDNIFTDSPVTYSTSADASLNEPGWNEHKPAVEGIGGTATKPETDLPTLRIYNSGSVVLEYNKPKALGVGPGGYQTIQAAINAASAGDTIQLAAGTYPEQLNITKGLSIIGEGWDKVTIDATTASAHGITVSSGDVTLQGFTLQGSTSNSRSRYGIHVASGGHQNINFSDLKVQDFYRTGIDINGADGVIVNNVTAVNNGGNGLQTCDAKNVTFSGITTSGNAWGGVGIFTIGQYSPIGTDGIVFTGENSFGESATDNGAIYLEEGNFANPDNPYPITFSTNPSDNANVMFITDDLQYMLSGSSDAAENYKRFYGTLEHVLSAANGNPGHIVSDIYIRSLSDGSFYVTEDLRIQTAINAAAKGDIIRVAAGTYNEALQINKSVELRGAQYGVDARNRTGVEESAITGGIVSISTAGAIIDGFTFTPPVWTGRIEPAADNITLRNNIIERAIYHTRNPEKAIENFTLSQNWFKNITDGNSAIVLEGATEDLTIEDNLFENISYSAIILGATTYENTVISGNAIYRTWSQAINLGGAHSNTDVRNNYIEQANMSGEPDKGGIRIYGTDFTGPVSIIGNKVVNSFNGFSVRNGGDITGKTIIVEDNTFIENSNAGVYNGASSGVINATNNYWGSAGPVVNGDVSYFPWYVDAGKERLANQGFNLTSPSKSRNTVTLSWAAAPGADGYNIYNGDAKANSAIITNTSYTVTGLSSSTAYSFSLTIVAGGTEYAVSDSAITVTTNSGGGGSNTQTPPPQQTPPPAPKALTDPQTKDDQKLNETLQSTGQASLDLTTAENAAAGLSTNTITQLAQENAPLVIRNTGVQVDFSPNSLITPELTSALQQPDAVVELGAKQVTEEEKQEILANAPLGESTGIFEVGGVIIDLTANIVTGGDNSTKIENFSEPVAVTIDLSGLDLTPEQISELSGVRFEKDETGAIVPVPLGGSYDPQTKTFTFYTTRFSLYSVVQVKDLVKLELTIGNQVSKVNGTDQNIDVPPTIINNRTMVPLRFIGEALGAEFVWDGKTRTVTFSLDGKELKVVIDQLSPGMDVPATIVGNRTIVPIRYISEAFGAEVTWFPTERKVTVVK